MATFIHTSDWHIGAGPGHFPREMRKKINRARLMAVEAIFIYAQREGIPLVLCTGDAVHNGQLVGEKHLEELFALFNRYPGITVVAITGSHDPLTANSVYRRVGQDKYPPNYHLVKGTEIIPIPGMNLKILAASAAGKEAAENPFAWIQPGDIDKTAINIGMAYGDFPLEPGFTRAKGLDYAALGGRHSFSRIGTHTCYPGTPEALDVDDNGYPLRVTVEIPGADPGVREVTGVRQYRWQRLEMQLADATFNDFKQTFEAVADKEIRQARVKGALSFENYKQYKELLQRGRGRYYEIIDQVALSPGESDLAEIDDGYVKELIRRLTDLEQSDEPLPKEIFDGVISGAQLEVEQSVGISKREIIDSALLKLFSHYCC